MSIHSYLEDLSNEIFFEIFDYLNALEIFTAFYSLNQRISSILQSIPLRIVIPHNYRRSQIEYLSSYLIFHAHQVVSLKINDTIRDDASIVSLLFDRHQFINLQSCVFLGVETSTKLENVIKQLKNSNTLVSFAIYQTSTGTLSENDLIPTMLMHKSSCLRSIHLQLPYDYLDISNYSSISSNITSLHLFIYGSSASVSAYSILPILRLCRSIRHLGIIIAYIDPFGARNQSVPIPTLKFSDWHMTIDRWRYGQYEGEYIILRTLNYHKLKSSDYVTLPCVNTETFATLPTTTEDHCVFYSDIKRIRVYISERTPVVTWPSSLYHNVDYLIIGMPKMSSIWNSLLTIVRLNETSDNDAQQMVTNLSYFVHLVNITRVEFLAVDISQWKHIQFILQACPKVYDLTIDTPLLFYWKLIDNPSLISFFKQIEILKLKTRNFYFHPNFASKVSQRFPALKTIELEVFSSNDCLDIIDIFLTQMENLSHIKINYHQVTPFDHPISLNYVLEKRRQKFPERVIDEKMVNLKKK